MLLVVVSKSRGSGRSRGACGLSERFRQSIRIAWIDNRLVLGGQLPSFYLKQQGQEALRGLEETIVNQIVVSGSNGQGIASCNTTVPV